MLKIIAVAAVIVFTGFFGGHAKAALPPVAGKSCTITTTNGVNPIKAWVYFDPSGTRASLFSTFATTGDVVGAVVPNPLWKRGDNLVVTPLANGGFSVTSAAGGIYEFYSVSPRVEGKNFKRDRSSSVSFIGACV